MATDADDWGTWRGQWLQVVAGDASLPHGAAAVAVFLAHKYADARTRTCWPSVATLAAEMGQQTRKRAQAAVTALSAAGYLDKRPGGGRASGSTKGAVRGASNFYRLTMPTGQPTAGTPANLTVPDTAHLTTVTVPEMAQLDTVNCPRNRLLTVPNRGHEPFHRTPPLKEGVTPLPPAKKKPATKRAAAASPNDLRRFLDAYPASIHRAPDAAVAKALAAAMKSASLEKILQGAARYGAERTAEDPRFTKCATNWLRGRGWEAAAVSASRPARPSAMEAAMEAAARVAVQTGGADDW